MSVVMHPASWSGYSKGSEGKLSRSVVVRGGAAKHQVDVPGPVAGHEAKQYSNVPQVSKSFHRDSRQSISRTSTGNAIGITKTTKSMPRNANGVLLSLPTPARSVTTRQTHGSMTVAQAAETPRIRQYHSVGNLTARVNTAPDGERLDLVLSPGDVLCVQGEAGAMTRLGATGGFMGHVLLVTAPPRGIHRHTTEALQFSSVWPNGNARVLWLVRTMESTRDAEGFHVADLLVYVEENTGNILTVAEEKDNHFHKFDIAEKVEVWQCPPELRTCFRLDVMHRVLAQMWRHEASWSWSTAIRAFLFSAKVPDDVRKATMMQEFQQCWSAEPICSSLVVVFWQRYLCELADVHNAARNITMTEVDALDWLLKWMPLKSDRALPGELLSTMSQCGWSLVSCISQDGRLRSTSSC